MTPKQGALLYFFKDTVTKHILYGGGARGGKTFGVFNIMVADLLSNPGIRWFIGRKQVGDIVGTLINSFQDVCQLNGILDKKQLKKSELRKRPRYNHNSKDKVITFFNGSSIVYRHLETEPSDPDFQRFDGLEITHAFIDEAQQVSKEAIDKLTGRCTYKVKEYDLTPKVIMCCNPGKGWLFNDYIRPYEQGKLDSERIFIPALAKDNPFIDYEKYKSIVLTTKNNGLIQRYIYGNWNYDDTPGRLFEYDDLDNIFTKNEGLNGDRYISCDVARKGKDKAVILVWEGWKIIDIKVFEKCSITELESSIRELMDNWDVDIDNVIVDEDGVGGGLVDNLGCRGFINNSKPISPFAARITDYKKANFTNLKTQCYFKLADIIKGKAISSKFTNIDFKEKLIEELQIICEIDLNKDGKKRITSKQEIKDILNRSPDYSDTVMMRMWFELKNSKPSYLEVTEQEDSNNDNPYLSILLEKAEEIMELEEDENWQLGNMPNTNIY